MGRWGRVRFKGIDFTPSTKVGRMRMSQFTPTDDANPYELEGPMRVLGRHTSRADAEKAAGEGEEIFRLYLPLGGDWLQRMLVEPIPKKGDLTSRERLERQQARA